MRLKFISICFFFLFSFLISCNSKSQGGKNETSSSNSSYNEREDEESSTSSEREDEESSTSNSSGCKFDDDTYHASVDYNNPETGYSATYDLDVVVRDCQVVEIDFPNDGYLDGDHISYADIDEDGNATVEGENGKTYEIKIEN